MGDTRQPLLQAALNGDRACSETLRQVRAACPGIPISLSTSAGIEPDPERRIALVAAWTDLPELVTANQGEDGILDLCDLLLTRGIGIEAGLLSLGAARPLLQLESHRVASEPWSSRSTQIQVTQPLTQQLWKMSSLAAALGSSTSTTATESPHGRSIAEPCPAVMGSEPDSRTPLCCPTGGKLTTTPTSSRPLRRSSAASSFKPTPEKLCGRSLAITGVRAARQCSRQHSRQAPRSLRGPARCRRRQKQLQQKSQQAAGRRAALTAG
jgi:hypothetical protein